MIPNGNQLIVYEEYINGKNLADLMKANATFEADEVTRLMLMLSDALTELHANAIIHRDIKPSNIMISSDGVLKLIDFDASRVFEVGKNQDTVNLGTIGYAAPEQYGYSQTDVRSDIYSIGVLMLELLLGKILYQIKNMPLRLKKLRCKQLPLILNSVINPFKISGQPSKTTHLAQATSLNYPILLS